MKLLILVLLISEAVSELIRYDDYSSFQLYPTSEDEINTIVNMSNQYYIDIIKHRRYLLVIEVAPELTLNISNYLTDAGILYNITENNIQECIDKRQEGISNDTINFEKYNPYPVIEDFLQSLENDTKVGPSGKGKIVSKNEIIGITEETENKTAKAIYLVKIFKASPSRGHCRRRRKKKAILIDGGMHAREWISTAFVLYLINQLKNNPSGSLEIEHLVNKFDWYIIPVLNPDGYVYSFEYDPRWRKNRKQSVEKNECYGVDINRNFDFLWDPAIGGSDDPCHYQEYAGTHAESEIETKALSDVMRRKGKKGKKRIHFIAYLSFHSFCQVWAYPWAYTNTSLPDEPELHAAAEAAADAIEPKYGTEYEVGQSASIFKLIAGTSFDFARGEIGIKYPYNVELPDKEEKGYYLPAERIKNITEETMEGVIAFAKHIH